MSRLTKKQSRLTNQKYIYIIHNIYYRRSKLEASNLTTRAKLLDLLLLGGGPGALIVLVGRRPLGGLLRRDFRLHTRRHLGPHLLLLLGPRLGQVRAGLLRTIGTAKFLCLQPFHRVVGGRRAVVGGRRTVVIGGG